MNRRTIQGKMNVQAWVQGDAFATVVDWLVRERGLEPDSIANAVELAFQELAMIAIDNGGTAIVDAESIDLVLQSIALNRYKGQALVRHSAKRFKSNGAMQELQKIEAPSAVHAHEQAVARLRIQQQGKLHIDASDKAAIEAEIKKALQQMKTGASENTSASDNSAFERAWAEKYASGSNEQDTLSEASDGEFDPIVARIKALAEANRRTEEE